jgi:hypothetical protein
VGAGERVYFIACQRRQMCRVRKPCNMVLQTHAPLTKTGHYHCQGQEARVERTAQHKVRTSIGAVWGYAITSSAPVPVA